MKFLKRIKQLIITKLMIKIFRFLKIIIKIKMKLMKKKLSKKKVRI